MSARPLTPSSNNYNTDRDKDTPSLLVQALELNQSQSSQVKLYLIVVFLTSLFTNFLLYLDLKNKNTVDSSATGHSSDDEDSNSGDSDGSHTVNHTRSNLNQQNNVIIQPQISQAQHSKLDSVDFLSSSGNNHDLHNTSISIEQSRHSFPTSISSGVSIISSLQGLHLSYTSLYVIFSIILINQMACYILGIPGLLPGPSGIHNNSQENNYGE